MYEAKIGTSMLHFLVSVEDYSNLFIQVVNITVFQDLQSINFLLGPPPVTDLMRDELRFNV